MDNELKPEPLNCLTAALYYAHLGWSVIPIGKDKKPLISWKKYQYESADEDQIRVWWIDFPDANVGIVTGKISGIVVIDVEKGGNIDDLPKTVTSRTGGGGWHAYCKHPGFEIPNATRIRPLTDIRGDGGYVIASPSGHLSGNKYEWITPPVTNELAELPQWVIEIRHAQPKQDYEWAEVIEGVAEGQRNTAGASLIGELISHLPEPKWESVAWPLFKAWNLQNDPQLPLDELGTVFNSITSRERFQRQPVQVAKIIIPNALEFKEQNFGEATWLVDGLIPIGGSAIFVAKRESYKTWLALYTAYCISQGLSLWDQFSTNKCKVLFISNDDPSHSFQKRLEQFSLDESFFVYHQGLPSFSLDQENGSFNSVKSFIKGHEIGLVIVDILRNTHNRDSNADKDAKWVFDRFKELREENTNLVFIFLIHPSKENSFEKRFGKRQVEEAVGSYYWEASVDTVISLRKTTNEDQTEDVVINVTKNKQSEHKIKPFIGIKKIPDGPVEFIYEESIPEDLKVEEAKDFILAALAEKDYERQELINLVVGEGICAPRTVEKALKQLFTEGKVTHTTTKPHVYSLTQEGSANRNTINTLRNAESQGIDPEQERLLDEIQRVQAEVGHVESGSD